MSTNLNNLLNCSESENDSSNVGRRNFIKSSSLALLAGALAQPASALTSSSFADTEKMSLNHYIDLTTTYTSEEVIRLYRGNTVSDRANTTLRNASKHKNLASVLQPFRAKDDEVKIQKLFYYDVAAKKFLDPLNVKPGLQAGKYSFETSVLNYHVTKKDNNDLWKGLKNIAQIQLGLSVPANPSDDLTWLALSGIDLFLGGNNRAGADSRLRSFLSNNKLTSDFVRDIEKIDITSGVGKIQLQVFGQKKQSIWQTILAIGGTLINSTAFATLPIPKLLPQSLKFAENILNQIQNIDSDNQLKPIWSGAKFDFRLYDGVGSKEVPYTLRPGLWLSIDRSFADQHLDEKKENFVNHFINMAGGFNELVDVNNQPVDANYSVLNFEFPKVA